MSYLVLTDHYAYIKNDIPALNLLGSKKWWDEKYIKRFGVESCSFTNAQVNGLYDECIVAAKKVLVEIEERLVVAVEESKVALLEHIVSRLSSL